MTIILRSVTAFRSFVSVCCCCEQDTINLICFCGKMCCDAAGVTNVTGSMTGGIFQIRGGYGIIQSADGRSGRNRAEAV